MACLCSPLARTHRTAWPTAARSGSELLPTSPGLPAPGHPGGLGKTGPLQRSLVEPEAVQAGSLPSMLQDPFLANTPPVSTSAQSQPTAMPWLTKVTPPQQAKETPAPEPKQTDEPDQPVRSNPDISEPLISAQEEPSHNEQPLPLLIPEESLERAWLRVSITPESTRADSIPMDQAKPSSRLKRLWQGLNRS